MKKRLLALLLFSHSALFLLSFSSWTYTKTTAPTKIRFQYNNEELIDIINYMAAQKGVNIIMPTGANAITSKVTLSIDEPLDLDQAWQLLITILDLAGYSLLPRGDMYIIIKNSNAISRESIPLFVSSDPEKLPDSDERIRFLYYLTNIKVSDAKNNEIEPLLKELLPAETATVQFDTKINAILITEKADNIKAAMKIITAIDQTTYQEKLEIVKLRYTNADVIAKLFNDNIIKLNADNRTRTKTKRSENTYFSEQVKIFPEPRTNKLIILGKAQAVTRVREFIYKYIDVELDSGESILHVYQLLYLDAGPFSETLNNIVRSEKNGGTGQSAAGATTGGVERYFDGVLVIPDQPRGGDKTTQNAFGSNKLIIAAKNEDWKYIKRLIEQLDKPQPQVIIEVLIADLTIDDIRSLGSSFRNPLNLPTPPGVNAQMAEIGPVVLDSCTSPTTVAADLLGQTITTSSGSCVSLASLNGVNQPAELGSTLIQVNDQATGATWGISQLLQLFNHTKILSHPHVIATNCKEAYVEIGSQRLVTGEATATAAAPTIKQEIIEANLQLSIMPRISSGDIVNLQVKIDINEFKAGSNTRLTRNINTCANVHSENILALGGLITTTSTDSAWETPILSKIPIFGWLFKKRRSEKDKTNLTVFICPTIIQPRLRGGIGEYTKDYVKLSQQYSEEAQLFDSLRDPITRFFFRGNSATSSVTALNDFLETDELKRDLMIEPVDARNKRTSERVARNKSTRKRGSTIAAALPEPPLQRTKEQLESAATQPIVREAPVAITKNSTEESGREKALKILLDQEKNPLLNV